MRKRVYVYIASPYTHNKFGQPATKQDKKDNLNRSLDAADKLLAAGLIPFAPLLDHYWDVRHPHTYEEWMAWDMAWLAKCDILLRLPGMSSGADREVERAHKLGITVYHDLETLLAVYNDLIPAIERIQYESVGR